MRSQWKDARFVIGMLLFVVAVTAAGYVLLPMDAAHGVHHVPGGVCVELRTKVACFAS